GDPDPPGAGSEAGAPVLRGVDRLPRDAAPRAPGQARRGRAALRSHPRVPRGRADVPRLEAGPTVGGREPRLPSPVPPAVTRATLQTAFENGENPEAPTWPFVS